MGRTVFLLSFLLVGTPLWSVSSGVILPHRSAEAIPFSSSPVSNSQASLVVPAETLIKARLLTGMHTLVSHVDDPIAAEMTEPVYISGHLALPAGTLFDGHITSVHPAGHMRKSGRIAFRFDHVTLPSGQEIPVTAVIASIDNAPGLKGGLDSEGHLQGQHKTSWRTFLTGFATVGGLSAAKFAAVGSTALTVAAPASAAAFVGYEFLLRRGGNVNVPPMTKCRIRLNSSLTVDALG